MYLRTSVGSSLSTSRPVAAVSAGAFVWPVSEYPILRTVQWPGGGLQSRVPSGWRRDVRSITSAEGTTLEVSASEVGNEAKSTVEAKPAFASKWFTRFTVWNAMNVNEMFLGLA